jgi:hypothetical protein
MFFSSLKKEGKEELLEEIFRNLEPEIMIVMRISHLKLS